MEAQPHVHARYVRCKSFTEYCCHENVLVNFTRYIMNSVSNTYAVHLFSIVLLSTARLVTARGIATAWVYSYWLAKTATFLQYTQYMYSVLMWVSLWSTYSGYLAISITATVGCNSIRSSWYLLTW